MNTEFIKGVIVPIITVINEDEKIDEAGMRDQVDYVIEGGLDGLTAACWASWHLAATASSM